MRKRRWFGAQWGWVPALLLVVAVPAPAQTVEVAPRAASALFEAVQRRDASAVASLLAGGADVNTARDDGSTPLIWAALRDAEQIVAVLLEAGADPNAADENGETALLFACGNGSLAIARMLLDAGAAVDAGALERRHTAARRGPRGERGARAAAGRPRRRARRGGAPDGSDPADVGRGRRPYWDCALSHRGRRRRRCALRRRFTAHPVRRGIGRCRRGAGVARRRGRPAR